MTKRSRHILSILLPITAFPFLAYFGIGFLFQQYIDSGAENIVTWEQQNLLSRDYGYVWQEINTNKEMRQISNIMDSDTAADSAIEATSSKTKDYPSLAAVSELNSLKNLHKTIRINDRNGIPLTQIRTTHTCVDLNQLNDTLLQALIITEDDNFYTRKKAYDYNSLLRSTLKAALRSIRTMSLHYPRGSSTIHMQVARFLLLRYNSRGYAYVEKTIARKLKEMKLAQALKSMYTDEEILTLYVNHCVSAGRGMQGYYDISMGLFQTVPESLSVAQSLYLSRIVKWNRHVPAKVIHQVKASIPALSRHFRWNEDEQESIRHALDTLTFHRPQPVITQRGYILDLANEYWRTVCRQNGMRESLVSTMDIANPESIVRRYGNLTIDLTIDYRLQRLLEKSVRPRGFGPDTTIRTDIRIGSYGDDLTATSLPSDTVRKILIFNGDTSFHDLPQNAIRALSIGDTVICNIRYRRKNKGTIRRSCFFYKRDTLAVPGQYHAYAMMDSKTRKLLAYYSTDQLGSRLRSLHVNRNPNGSSVAKPLIYALAYDLGIYQPCDMARDDQEVGDSCVWARSFLYHNDTPTGMIFHNVPEDSGYAVQNHSHTFDGYDFLYNHLSHSNNILAVQTMYKLTTTVKERNNQTEGLKQLFRRLRRPFPKSDIIPGPQVYGALVETMRGRDSTIHKHAQNYSVALGTIELSLYEQMHLFNILYDNVLTITPKNHPSLFLKKIRLGTEEVTFTDAVDTTTVFSSINNLAPVHLALHKRLVSNPSDNLHRFDITEGDGPRSNFAKSGTTDDIIRPFNADITDTSKTNYGLWNAVLRLQLSRNAMRRAVREDSAEKIFENVRLSYEDVPKKETLDVTIAGFGECNTHYTGPRDGKSLHGYISRDLLHAFGVSSPQGYYASYEQELMEQTSDSKKYAAKGEDSNLSFFSRALIRLQTGLGNQASPDEVSFEEARFGSGLRLRGKSYRMMLKFAQYMGEESKHYRDLIGDLKRVKDRHKAEQVISQIDSIHVSNQILKRDLHKACTSLRESLEQWAEKR